MSSKVLAGETAPAFGPVEWRSVPGRQDGRPDAPEDQPAEASAPAAPPPPSPEMEIEYARKIAEAHEAGVREGEAAGRNRAAAELQPVLARLARSIEEISSLRARLRKEAEADLVSLSLAIARRVLRREIAVDPDAIRGLIVAAVEKLEVQDISRVRIHPAHAALLAGCLREQASGSAVEVVSDGSCEPGTVIFETARGNLDASVGTQLDEIERGLADRLRRRE